MTTYSLLPKIDAFSKNSRIFKISIFFDELCQNPQFNFGTKQMRESALINWHAKD